jgi:hypothetical protein
MTTTTPSSQSCCAASNVAATTTFDGEHKTVKGKNRSIFWGAVGTIGLLLVFFGVEYQREASG